MKSEFFGREFNRALSFKALCKDFAQVIRCKDGYAVFYHGEKPSKELVEKMLSHNVICEMR